MFFFQFLQLCIVRSILFFIQIAVNQLLIAARQNQYILHHSYF